MSIIYTKGKGDFEQDCKPEPTDDQIISAMRNNPDKVSKNALSSFSMELTSALFVLAKFDSDEQLRDVLNKSAIDLLERGEI